jgi:transketolase
MRNAYIAELYEIAVRDERVLALVADNGAIVYDKFRAAFPDRFINFGIAEANMVSVAAGLAACGKIPFAYTIAGFLTMRAYEQIRNDVCMQRTNVKLVGIGAGFVYSNLGPTHHATVDISIMRALPGMTVFSPADPLESRKITQEAARMDGPVYIRIATGGSPKVYESDYEFVAGKGVVMREGGDVTLVATGGIVLEAQRACEELSKEGIGARLINIHTIKPLDEELILQAARETRAVLTVEEHSIIGGLGGAVAETLAEAELSGVKFRRMGLKGVFAEGYGTYEEMKEQNGLSSAHIAAEALRLCRVKN